MRCCKPPRAVPAPGRAGSHSRWTCRLACPNFSGQTKGVEVFGRSNPVLVVQHNPRGVDLSAFAKQTVTLNSIGDVKMYSLFRCVVHNPQEQSLPPNELRATVGWSCRLACTNFSGHTKEVKMFGRSNPVLVVAQPARRRPECFR